VKQIAAEAMKQDIERVVSQNSSLCTSQNGPVVLSVRQSKDSGFEYQSCVPPHNVPCTAQPGMHVTFFKLNSWPPQLFYFLVFATPWTGQQVKLE
jgi:hypothetical protein